MTHDNGLYDSHDYGSGTVVGWWMAPGPTLCASCEQPHHVEAMLYCSDCDAIVCAVCVVVSVDSDPRCPVCHGNSGEW